jgi:photosystem II stability/assembly factor-like uncharacterized protein
MERAVTLIGKGDKVEAVALQVGYRSKKNFYRQFTIRFGVTPAAYRVRALTATPNQQCEVALLKSLSFRSIGPAVSGGPVVALAGVEGRPSTLYVGTAGGGLWKTVNNGTTWQPVFESKNGAGNLTVTAADADLIWIANGNDLYRSTDGGRTWTDVGRSDWRRIGRIVVDPKHCDTVYVAVSGGRTGADPNRGLYKTTDAGLSWTRVLFIDEYTGIADVLLDPTDSQTLLATAGARRRARANGYGGDAGQIGGVYKTSDGGSSWRRVTSALPAGNARRITLGLCSRTPSVAYAAIESADGGIYRSCDSGETWRRLNVPNVNAARISDIKVDPRNHRKVYVASDRLYVSDDGGDTFSTGESPCAVRTIWIDPFDPERIAIGADSGLYMSYDHGATWQVCQNLPIASFTRIGADMRKPYRLFCSSHAAGTWAGPHSARTRDGVSSKDWFRLPGEGSFVQVDPTDPNLVYTAGHGQLARHDLETGEVKFIHPDPGNYGASAHRRVSILISRHHTSTLFAGLASIYKSTDRGLTWTVISRALGVPPERGQRSPGETRTSRSLDTATAPMVNVLAESARASGLLYAGFSNGNVLVTRDGGRTWTNVTGRFTAVPKTRVVSCIATSTHEANTAYVTFDARQSEDYAPYVFTTTDGGRSWTSIASNLPGGPVNAVREDPRSPQLLYAGTECGLFVSLDRGTRWELLENDLPAVAINDVLLHPRENDLVVSTRGRGIWILDDIAPLQ